MASKKKHLLIYNYIYIYIYFKIFPGASPRTPPPKLSRASSPPCRLRRQLLTEFPVDASVRNLPRSAPVRAYIQ